MSIQTINGEKALGAGEVGATPWVRIQTAAAVQITGTATAFTVLVERSTRDPAASPGPNTAVVETLTGNLATGVAPVAYDEPGDGWWRARATVVTGGTALIAINGKYGG